VLLLDEPFAALDAQTRELMQSELLKIWSRAGKTVLFITHQIDEAVFLADRVVVMGTRPGRIKGEFEVPFERPRSLAVKRAPAFLATCDQIAGLIDNEAARINVVSTD
jgi:NitT/TauT family transport system ATP-binding protein